MKRKKLIIAIGAGAGMLLAAAAVLPPVLLSSGWVRKMIFSRVPGELAAESCAIGWRQGLQCSKVVYRNAGQNLRVEIAEARGSQGLWPLLKAPKELGVITLDGLALVMDRPAQKISAAPAEQQKKAAPDSSGKTAVQPPAAQDSSDFFQKMKAKLAVSRAEVTIAPAGQPPETLLGSGTLKADLAAGELRFELAGQTGSEGRAAAAGFVKLPAGGDLAADIQLTLAEVQIKSFLALKPGKAGLPQGSGRLAAALKVTSEDGGLTVRGPLTLTDADLTGGFLGEDHPRFGRLAFDLDAQQPKGGGWQLHGLQMASDFGSLNLRAADEGAGLQGSGKGKLDLALLLTQFPRLFKMREEVRLDSGELDIAADLSKEAGCLRVAADAALNGLAGRRDGQSFAWDSPLTLNVVGILDSKEPKVDKLTIAAPFLNLEGQGDLNRFALHGSADLDQAMQEIGRIIRLDWDAGGRLELDLQLEKKDSGRYAVSAKAEIADCRLSRQGKELLPPATTSFSGQLETPGQIPESEADAADLSFALSSWAGKVSGKLEGLHRKNGKISVSYDLQTNLALARVTELLHKFEAIDEETSLAGTLELESSGYTEASRLVLRKLDSRVHDFIFYRQGKIFRDPALHLFTLKPETDLKAEQAVRPLIEAENSAAFFAEGGGYSLLDTASRRLVLRDLEFSSGFGGFKTKLLALDDWQRNPLPIIKNLQVSGSSDLAKLAALLQYLGVTKPEQKLGGNAVFSVDLSEQGGLADGAGKGNTGTVAIDLDRFFFGKEGGILTAKDKVEFRSRLHGDLAAGDIYFTTFDLQSDPLVMQSSGRLQLDGQNPQLSLEGSATPDLADLVAVINGMYPLGISAEGRQKEKFSLVYPLSGKRQADLQFAGRLHADTFAKSGIEISGMSLDTGMKDGVMTAVLKGSLNGGTVQLSPKIDYTRTPPLLTLTESEEVLVKVGLEQALADVLKGIHPILGALASPAGTISIRAERFSMPVGAQGFQQADFKAVLDLSEVALEPVSALAGILDLAGLSGQPLRLKEKSLACEGQKGRIACSPIKMTVADSEMIMTGSAGFDGGLDYVVEVPVTKNLVGKKGYELLKGATLKVPVKGTKDKPVYDPEAMMQAASDLLGQAAKHAAKETIKEQIEKVVPKELEQAVPNLPGLIDGLFGK